MTVNKEIRQQYEHAEATLYDCFVRALEQHRLFCRCECGAYFEPCLAIGTIDFDALELVMKCAKCAPFAQGERVSEAAGLREHLKLSKILLGKEKS